MNPASSRSSVRSDHALIAPDSHVLSVLPGWPDCDCTVLISPHLGAEFTQYISIMHPGASAGAAPSGVQRFFFVLEGQVNLEVEGKTHTLGQEHFAYLPPDIDYTIHTAHNSRLMVFEKPYEPIKGHPAPRPVIGNGADVDGVPYMGDPDALLQTLLPEEMSFDMAINLFTFKPGATLPFVEVHIMEHGLLVLDGQGIYRLGDQWYPVEKNDVIWMAPYCPQYYVASGKENTRYLYYKNMHRHPLNDGDL